MRVGVVRSHWVLVVMDQYTINPDKGPLGLSATRTQHIHESSVV